MVMVDGTVWQQTGVRTPDEVCDAICQLHLAHLQGQTDRFDADMFDQASLLADEWAAAAGHGSEDDAFAAHQRLVEWVDFHGWTGCAIDPRILEAR